MQNICKITERARENGKGKGVSGRPTTLDEILKLQLYTCDGRGKIVRGSILKTAADDGGVKK